MYSFFISLNMCVWFWIYWIKKLRFDSQRRRRRENPDAAKTKPKIHHKDAEKGCDVVATRIQFFLDFLCSVACKRNRTRSFLLHAIVFAVVHSAFSFGFRICKRIHVAFLWQREDLRFSRRQALNWLSPDSVTRIPGLPLHQYKRLFEQMCSNSWFFLDFLDF